MESFLRILRNIRPCGVFFIFRNNFLGTYFAADFRHAN